MANKLKAVFKLRSKGKLRENPWTNGVTRVHSAGWLSQLTKHLLKFSRPSAYRWSVKEEKRMDKKLSLSFHLFFPCIAHGPKKKKVTNRFFLNDETAVTHDLTVCSRVARILLTGESRRYCTVFELSLRGKEGSHVLPFFFSTLLPPLYPTTSSLLVQGRWLPRSGVTRATACMPEVKRLSFDG